MSEFTALIEFQLKWIIIIETTFMFLIVKTLMTKHSLHNLYGKLLFSSLWFVIYHHCSALHYLLKCKNPVYFCHFIKLTFIHIYTAVCALCFFFFTQSIILHRFRYDKEISTYALCASAFWGWNYEGRGCVCLDRFQILTVFLINCLLHL